MALYDNSVLSGCGPILIDPNGHTIWCVKSNAIQYSDNYGTTWQSWASLSSHLPHSNMWGPGLIKDLDGNFYYSGKTGDSNSLNGLYRVDAITKTLTLVATLGSSTGRLTHWGGTIGADGKIWLGIYDITAPESDQACLYMSERGGASFTDLNVVHNYVDRHVHDCKCDPYTGHIYITGGDTPKILLRSTNNGSSFTQLAVGQSTGYTGLTFTSEGGFGSDDWAPKTGNKLVRINPDGSIFTIKTMTGEYDSMMYHAVAIGDNEIWVTNANEWQYADMRSGLHKFSRVSKDVWTMETILSMTGLGSPMNPGYIYIGSDVHACSPLNHPYIYVYTGYLASYGTIRVQRVSDALLAQLTPTATVATVPAVTQLPLTLQGTKSNAAAISISGTSGTVTYPTDTTWTCNVIDILPGPNTLVVTPSIYSWNGSSLTINVDIGLTITAVAASESSTSSTTITGTCTNNATISFSVSPTGPVFSSVTYNRNQLPLNTWSCTVSNLSLSNNGNNTITVTCSLGE